MTKTAKNPIKVPANILEGLKAVRECGSTNMFDVKVVQLQAVALGYPEAAEWIEENTSDYIEGVFKNFTVD